MYSRTRILAKLKNDLIKAGLDGLHFGKYLFSNFTGRQDHIHRGAKLYIKGQNILKVKNSHPQRSPTDDYAC